jgi:hypothetical protein
MVGSWQCKVSSKIHINGHRISEPVCEDKGLADRRDPKRAHVILSMGHEVVGSSYSMVTGVAAQVTNKKENSGKHGRVNRVSQNSNTD